MDVDNRKNEEKGAGKKVDLEIEVGREINLTGNVHGNVPDSLACRPCLTSHW